MVAEAVGDEEDGAAGAGNGVQGRWATERRATEATEAAGDEGDGDGGGR